VTDKPEPTPLAATPPPDQRRRLLRGVAFAAGAIALLLGAAVVLERHRAKLPVAPATVVERPASAPAKLAAEEAVPAKPPESVVPAQSPAAVAPAPLVAPASTPAPAAVSADRPSAATSQAPTAANQIPAAALSTKQDEQPTTAPANDKIPSGSPNQVQANPASAPDPATQRAAEPAAKPDCPAPAAKPRAHQSLPPSTRSMGAPDGTGYQIQVGVFGNPANAEKLRIKLESSGIPAQFDVRVRAGPFPDKRSAAEAAAKIRAMGIEPTLVLPPRR
jgi:cell division protein FtsN